jgi:hypothetical protein
MVLSGLIAKVATILMEMHKKAIVPLIYIICSVSRNLSTPKDEH